MIGTPKLTVVRLDARRQPGWYVLRDKRQTYARTVTSVRLGQVASFFSCVSADEGGSRIKSRVFRSTGRIGLEQSRADYTADERHKRDAQTTTPRIQTRLFWAWYKENGIGGVGDGTRSGSRATRELEERRGNRCRRLGPLMRFLFYADAAGQLRNYYLARDLARGGMSMLHQVRSGGKNGAHGLWCVLSRETRLVLMGGRTPPSRPASGI